MRIWLYFTVGVCATGAAVYCALYGPTSLFAGALALLAYMIWLLGTDDVINKDVRR